MILTRPGYEKEEGDFAVLRSGALRIGLQPLDISSDPSTGIIVGRVSARESGEPLSAVTVTLVGTELRAETMSDGLFEIRNVLPAATSSGPSAWGWPRGKIRSSFRRVEAWR